jgi:multiple sugar transport system substrate-binding protein
VIEYGSRGALLDLRDIDTTKIDTATTKAAQVEGKQLGVPTGIATLAIVANPTLFKQAGIEMPNDETWTWDEYAKIAQKISDNSPDGVYGSQALGTDANQIADWARQRGEDQWTEDGKLGLTVDTVAGFYEFAKKMVDSGAAPSADEASEQTGVGLEQTGTALNHYAMGYWATNQLSSLELVSKAGLELLRLPGTSGSKGDHKMAFGASQYWAAASRSKHPAEAQMLIDFLANSTEAGKLLLVGRGSPVNSDVREAVLPLLDESKAKIVDFVTEVQPETVAANVAPAGVSAFQDNMRRYTAEVYFNRMTPKEAAKGLLDETQASIK